MNKNSPKKQFKIMKESHKRQYAKHNKNLQKGNNKVKTIIVKHKKFCNDNFLDESVASCTLGLWNLRFSDCKVLRAMTDFSHLNFIFCKNIKIALKYLAICR